MKIVKPDGTVDSNDSNRGEEVMSNGSKGEEEGEGEGEGEASDNDASSDSGESSDDGEKQNPTVGDKGDGKSEAERARLARVWADVHKKRQERRKKYRPEPASASKADAHGVNGVNGDEGDGDDVLTDLPPPPPASARSRGKRPVVLGHSSALTRAQETEIRKEEKRAGKPCGNSTCRGHLFRDKTDCNFVTCGLCMRHFCFLCRTELDARARPRVAGCVGSHFGPGGCPQHKDAIGAASVPLTEAALRKLTLDGRKTPDVALQDEDQRSTVSGATSAGHMSVETRFMNVSSRNMVRHARERMDERAIPPEEIQRAMKAEPEQTTNQYGEASWRYESQKGCVVFADERCKVKTAFVINGSPLEAQIKRRHAADGAQAPAGE